MNAHAKPVAEATILATTIPARDLVNAMRLICGIIPRWSALPALSYVHLTANAGEITLRATDLDTELTLRLEAETARPGEVAIRAAALLGFATAATGPITIEGRAGTASAKQPEFVVLRDAQFVSRQRSIIDTADLPHKTVKGDQVATCAQTPDQWRRMISMCRHCISTEETRYYLNGIFLTTKPDGTTLRAVATDGHRLGAIDTDAVPTGTPNHIIPKPAIDQLMPILKVGGNEPVGLTLYDRHFVVTGPDFTFKGTVIDDTYPNYVRVIPTTPGDIKAVVSAAMLKRLKSVALHFDDRFKHARFDIEAQTLGVTGGDGDVSMPCPIRCPQEKPATAFGANLRYLVEQAGVTPEFSIHCTTASDPLMIHGEDPDALFVIMPARLEP